jgi:rhamnogalacturonyl hydrolase YesR
MVRVLASSVVYHGLETRLGQIKDYEIGICCYSVKHVALRSKNKDYLARNQNNVSEWIDMSARELFFQSASTMKIKLSVLL